MVVWIPFYYPLKLGTLLYMPLGEPEPMCRAFKRPLRGPKREDFPVEPCKTTTKLPYTRSQVRTTGAGGEPRLPLAPRAGVLADMAPARWVSPVLKRNRETIDHTLEVFKLCLLARCWCRSRASGSVRASAMSPVAPHGTCGLMRSRLPKSKRRTAQMAPKRSGLPVSTYLSTHLPDFTMGLRRSTLASA